MDGSLPTTATSLGWRPKGAGRIALVLQGGGALGAYQVGVYEALHEAGLEPDWVSGVSIGAINSALIAGNPPERRLERLVAFWERITERQIWPHMPDGDVYRQAHNLTSSLMTTMLGQPGFFAPNSVNPWLAPAGAKAATSYYDNGPLRETLLELVDFKLLNTKACRFSVGAVNVRSGNFVFFDNETTEIAPEHIMASGALPPAFPSVKIGTDYFWDGGIVSNTPLAHLLAQDDDVSALVFQVDLFSARGPLPRTIQDVAARQKDIMYSSRTRQITDSFQRLQRWKKRAYNALIKAPDADLTDEERAMRDKLAKLPGHSIIHLIYQQQSYESAAKDHEFSGASMREHRVSGHEDTKHSLGHKKWLEIPESGVATHDVHRESDR